MAKPRLKEVKSEKEVELLEELLDTVFDTVMLVMMRILQTSTRAWLCTKPRKTWHWTTEQIKYQ